MRNLILLLALCGGGYQAWQHFSRAPHESNTPLHAEPYLAVYGRDSCGYTLPVVDLHNRIAVHPDNAELLAQARELALD